jgi:glucan phosphoethanolaminetransferase (alkaline phosphatase superfamily)
MNNRVLFISLFGLFIILNLVPTYLWLWGMSFIDLERPKFSSINVETRDTLNSFLRFILIVGIWLPILLVVWKRKWKIKALTIPALMSLILFVIMYKSQEVYPDEESQFSKNGYQYRNEKWNEKNQLKIVHWKSRDSFKNYISDRHIEWILIKKEIKN